MNPIQLLLIFRARWKTAILVLLLTAGVGIAVGLQLPKRYNASVSIVFDIKNRDPIAGMLLPMTAAYLGTQMEIIRSDRVAHKVIRTLKLDESPAVRKQWMDATEGKGPLNAWLGGLLQNGLQVKTASNSSIMNITFTSNDPAFAAVIANGFAQAYIDANIELRVDPARQYARWFEEQGKVYRENLEKAQAQLSAFQRGKGIVASENQVDAEMVKLNDLMGQLTVTQLHTAEAYSKQRSGADTLPEIMQNSLIQTLKSDIARQEAKLQEVAGNLGTNHPQYQRMQSELAALRQRLEQETRHATRGLSTTTMVSTGKEAELRAAIEAQKKKLLRLKADRDQLAVLQRDVDAAQSAYATIATRLNQTTMESQMTQANVSVLTPAVEPREPASPKPLRIIALMAVALGVVLGLAAAIGLEMLNRRIRSVADLTEMLQLPVLAEIGRYRKPRRSLFRRRKTALALR